jgi:toxin ParE1/3/4
VAWILTAAALADLDVIAAEGARQFGFKQSEIYERRLVDMLDTLAGNPRLAAERLASQSIIRLMPVGAHNIVYIVEDEDVLIPPRTARAPKLV